MLVFNGHKVVNMNNTVLDDDAILEQLDSDDLPDDDDDLHRDVTYAPPVEDAPDAQYNGCVDIIPINDDQGTSASASTRS